MTLRSMAVAVAAALAATGVELPPPPVVAGAAAVAEAPLAAGAELPPPSFWQAASVIRPAMATAVSAGRKNVVMVVSSSGV